MKLYFDSIIFFLQKNGGISVLNNELKLRMINDNNIELINNNTLSKLSWFNLFHSNLKKCVPLVFRRYLSPIVFYNRKFIFHSSYYRICNNKNAINIITVHDFIYEKYKKGYLKYFHILQKRFAIIKADHIVCVSNNTKTDLLQFYPNINPNKISVIHNGVDSSYKPLGLNSFNLNSLGIKFISKSYVLYIGDRKSEYKNFDFVVKVCQVLKINLVLIGSKLSKNELFQLNNNLGRNNFIQLSMVSNDNLNIIYNSAFCLLYPSIYEGFGIPILEAQRAGCPVITSCANAIKETAGDGAILLENISENSIIEAILSLRNDELFYSTIIKKGFDNSSKYSWDKCYKGYKNIYISQYSKSY